MELKDLLSRLKGVKPFANGEYMAICPSHDDHKPSLSIRQSDNKILLNCKAGCSTDKVIKALEITISDLFVDSPKPEAKIETIYKYQDTDGKILFEVVRYVPKGFRQRQPNNAGGYTWNLNGIIPVLYHLPEITKAVKCGDTIYITEGEKDCDKLWDLGLVATCNPMGAGKWRETYSDTLASGNIVIIPHNDTEGKTHAQRVAKSLLPKVASLKVVTLPNAKDIADWLQGNHTHEELKTLLSQTPNYFPQDDGDKPKIDSVGDVFVADWGEDGVSIKIDRIHEKPDGTSAEVLVIKDGSHLYQTRLNLLSSQGKKGLIGELEKRDNRPDWQSIVEKTFTEILGKYREGEPIIAIGNLPRRETPRYRLKPFILENQISALYAHGDSCKSLLADLWAIMVQCGVPLLGFNPIQGNVLILDWETSKETADERIKAIKAGMGISDKRIPYYRKCSHLLTHDIAEIQKAVIDKKIELVIVDSAGMAAGFDNDYHSVAIEMLRALRTLNISVLIIDHKPKSAETMFGSVYKFNECRAAFEVKTSQEAGSSCVDVALYHTKHNDTPRHSAIGLHIEFEGNEDYTETITFSQKDISDMPELEAGLTIAQRIVAILKGGAMEKKDIAEQTGINEDSVKVTLNRRKDLFVRTEGNRWGLLLKEEYA